MPDPDDPAAEIDRLQRPEIAAPQLIQDGGKQLEALAAGFHVTKPTGPLRQAPPTGGMEGSSWSFVFFFRGAGGGVGSMLFLL